MVTVEDKNDDVMVDIDIGSIVEIGRDMLDGLTVYEIDEVIEKLYKMFDTLYAKIDCRVYCGCDSEDGHFYDDYFYDVHATIYTLFRLIHAFESRRNSYLSGCMIAPELNALVYYENCMDTCVIDHDYVTVNHYEKEKLNGREDQLTTMVNAITYRAREKNIAMIMNPIIKQGLRIKRSSI